ncbi:MAG: R3H domain-containing nucleic acid-binding protein [Patescibacteria group bacterium]
MNQFQEIFKKLIELMGFEDFSVNYDESGDRLSVFINDDIVSESNLPTIISVFNYLLKLMAVKNNLKAGAIDVNNYRKKREDLILELARAAARKCLVEKQEISLPIMNAYERRLVHMELIKNPDIKTESIGEERERKVVIRPS